MNDFKELEFIPIIRKTKRSCVRNSILRSAMKQNEVAKETAYCEAL